MEVESEFSFSNGTCFPRWNSGSNHHSQTLGGLQFKRKRTSTADEGVGCHCVMDGTGCRSSVGEATGGYSPLRRSFVLLDANRGVYQSESYKSNGSTLYLPLNNSLLVNMKKYDQVSFEEGFFCIGDASGGCLQKVQGHVINCWRYNVEEKKLFIALSFLFVSKHVFEEVVRLLERV
ncbi:uncharacterized protein si:dkey-109l4.3 [Erpetoichthys calabaricus]|uniref:uncharacterized protein si:dkey-109l4.3 n=1 Tax=Erpetoichthys calabaricus TaxID=27687 RepID=UPI002233E411|nr:uncharacterized protein si:dkey-109l4.3 [Erpetoichthys calabaricus]